MNGMNFFIAGVGGQGTVLISNVLAEVGVQAGLDVKKTEVHGMAQRGGSVTTHVRWGEKVYSPVIVRGEADFLIALEKLESLRYVDMLRPGGVVLLGDACIPPLTVSSGLDRYPSDAEVQAVFAQVTSRCFLLPVVEVSQALGNSRVQNAVLLGALSRFLEQVPVEVWRQAIAERVPHKHVETNRQAFEAGRALLPAPA